MYNETSTQPGRRISNAEIPPKSKQTILDSLQFQAKQLQELETCLMELQNKLNPVTYYEPSPCLPATPLNKPSLVDQVCAKQTSEVCVMIDNNNSSINTLLNNVRSIMQALTIS